MTNLIESWKEHKTERIREIESVLNSFGQKPLNILEIGASKILGDHADGCSTLAFAEYVKQHGGKFVVVDKDFKVIKDTRQILESYLPICDIQLNIGDGLNFISAEFDLVFLDGSDSFIEALKQFEKVGRARTTVLIDKFEKRGLLLKAKYSDFLSKDLNSSTLAIYNPQTQTVSNSSRTICNIANDTGQIICVKRDGKNIVQAAFFGENRDPDYFEWHKKVFEKFGVPINYVRCPFPSISHGTAINQFIRATAQLADYWVFWETDSIPLIPSYFDFIYQKISDNFTVFGVTHQSNHKVGPNGTYNHPYCGPSIHGISKNLYVALGCPTYGDEVPRSDTAEEITYAAQEKGFGTYMLWPSAVVGITDEECVQYNIDPKHKYSDLGNGLKFGLGTTYGDLFYHQMCQNIPRSKILFVEKCKSILLQ